MKEADILLDEIALLRRQLAAAQMNNAKLRNQLVLIFGPTSVERSYPCDDTALREMIAEAKREVLNEAASKLATVAWYTVSVRLRKMAEEIKP